MAETEARSEAMDEVRTVLRRYAAELSSDDLRVMARELDDIADQWEVLS